MSASLPFGAAAVAAAAAVVAAAAAAGEQGVAGIVFVVDFRLRQMSWAE